VWPRSRGRHVAPAGEAAATSRIPSMHAWWCVLDPLIGRDQALVLAMNPKARAAASMVPCICMYMFGCAFHAPLKVTVVFGDCDALARVPRVVVNNHARFI
jgi:hypothetical protein